MFKNHDEILVLEAMFSRWHSDLDDPSFSVEGQYSVLCWTRWFLQHYDCNGWLEYHKRLNSNLSDANSIVEYYENRDESLRIKHDKIYDQWSRGREYDPARWAAKRKT